MSLLTTKLEEDNNLIELPEKYIEILNEAVEKAVDLFKDNLLSITLGGSGGKNHVHVGWSDLNLYFILKEYNLKQMAKYNREFNNCEIHLGTTFYTLKEVEKQMINFKTKIMIYEKYKYLMNPTIYGEDYFLPVSYETIRQNDVSNLPNILHSYKETILYLKNGQMDLKKKHVKKMLILLKCLLNYHNIFSFGYEEVLIKYSKLCNEFGFDGERGFKIIKIIDDYDNIEQYKDEIVKFSEDIFKFIYKYC